MTFEQAIVALRLGELSIKSFMELSKQNGWNLTHYNRLVDKQTPPDFNAQFDEHFPKQDVKF